MAVGESRWTFLLQPTGRVEVLARVTMIGDETFRLDTDPGFGPVLEARLNRFKIRVKATVALVDDRAGSLAADDDARIAACWPKMGAEIIPGETIPAETGLADVAVSFTKGCYPGQELVERMDSRGSTAPRHLSVLPRRPDDVPGAAVCHDGAVIGTITSVGTTQVLAYIKRGHDGSARLRRWRRRRRPWPRTSSGCARSRWHCRRRPKRSPGAPTSTSGCARRSSRSRQGGSLMVKADRDELPALLADPRFRPAPYLARGGWVVMELASAPDWAEVEELIHTSYCLIAPKTLAAQVGSS